MAKDGITITTAELKRVVSSLKSERDLIQNTYKSQIKSVLESSETCFKVAGLDYTSIINTFDSTFSMLYNRFNSLIEVLENNVIRNYDELSSALIQMFGQNFASQLSSLLGINR